MSPRCNQCHESVDDRSVRVCPACGADFQTLLPLPRGRRDRDEVNERENAELLAAVIGLAVDLPPRPRAEDVARAASLLERELTPVRIGRFPSPDDVLPTTPTKRGRRHR